MSFTIIDTAAREISLKQLGAALRRGVVEPWMLARRAPYAAEELDQLAMDVIALANQPGDGKRFIVLGAEGTGTDQIRFTGLSHTEHLRGFECANWVSACIEPLVRVSYLQWPLGSRPNGPRTSASANNGSLQLGVLVVDGCNNPPYLARRNVGRAVRAGDGWIRERDVLRRLTRSDFDRYASERLADPLFKGDVAIRFAGDSPGAVLRLPVTDLSALPSRRAAEQIETLLSAKESARALNARHDTYIARLAYARAFGGDAVYVNKGVETLRAELKDLEREFSARDQQYKFLQQAHRVNVQIEINGDADLENVSLALSLPANVGLEVRIDSTGDASSNASLSCRDPTLETTARDIRIGATYARLPNRTSTVAFSAPLRVCFAAKAAGYKFPLRFVLHARNLRQPITGKLYIVCTRERGLTATPN